MQAESTDGGGELFPLCYVIFALTAINSSPILPGERPKTMF